MDERRAWLWKAALVGFAAAIASRGADLLWVRAFGEAGYLLVWLPERLVFPGATLGSLLMFAAKDILKPPQQIPLLPAAILNSLMYVGAAGYFRFARSRGAAGRAVLATLAGVYLLGELCGLGVFWFLTIVISTSR